MKKLLALALCAALLAPFSAVQAQETPAPDAAAVSSEAAPAENVSPAGESDTALSAETSPSPVPEPSPSAEVSETPVPSDAPIAVPSASMSAWARAGVTAAYEKGLVDPGFTLGGDYARNISRVQLARLTVDLYDAEKAQTAAQTAAALGVAVTADGSGALALSGPGSFSDTRSAYAELAAKLGIVKGSNGAFHPEANVTRAEAAAMLRRCMAALGVTEANAAPAVFSDAWAIPRWAVEDVKFVSGRTDGATALMGGAVGAYMPLGGFTIEQAIITLGRMDASLPLTAVAAGWRNAGGYDTVRLALTFGGDCTFGRDRGAAYAGSFDEMYDLKGKNYFFSGIPMFYDDDLTMVNFEGTLTTADTPAQKTFRFKGRPEYAGILPAGSIDVVTLANNHSLDYLQRGFSDTVQNLSPVVAVSGYDALPIVTVKGVKIGFASNTGWNWDSAQQRFIQGAIASLRARGAEIIVFNYHWGVEKTYHSNATQQAIAHYAIDQGADLVIGNHPHVVQETETYHGKQIAYSLGNLVFGGNMNPSDKNCLIFRESLTLDLDTRRIVAEEHNAVPYRVSSVNWRNDFHPVPA